MLPHPHLLLTGVREAVRIAAGYRKGALLMSLAQRNVKMTPEEYLAFERASETRHDYWDGQVYAMAGESERHSKICTNISTALTTRLRGRGCVVFSPNMKVKTASGGPFVYADVIVTCGARQYHDEKQDLLLNPQVIVEVLSPSTADYDREEKFARYREIESLIDYVLVSQRRPYVEHFIRQDKFPWGFSVASDLNASIHLTAIRCDLPLVEVYEEINFPVLPLFQETS
jgi:Uma2 family endonuclease